MSFGVDAREHNRIGEVFSWVVFTGSSEKKDIDTVFVGLFEWDALGKKRSGSIRDFKEERAAGLAFKRKCLADMCHLSEEKEHAEQKQHTKNDTYTYEYFVAFLAVRRGCARFSSD